MKKTALLALLLLSLCVGCGSEEASVSSTESAAESAGETLDSTGTDVAASAEEGVAASSAEASVVEEELSIDEQFAALTADAQGVCLKLQIYNQKGTPVRNGRVTLETESGETITANTDQSGYALLLDLALDTDYTMTVVYEDDSPVGSAALAIQSGDSYAGGAGEDALLLEVGSGDTSLVDLAITATDENGEASSFTISRVSAWTAPAGEE